MLNPGFQAVGERTILCLHVCMVDTRVSSGAVKEANEQGKELLRKEKGNIKNLKARYIYIDNYMYSS